MSVKYPEIRVPLLGEDSNAFSILARVDKALHKADVPDEEREEFNREARKGDFDHLLRTVMSWVDTDPEDEDY